MDNRQTQIIATIGDASEKPETIFELIVAGVDIFRFSYGRDSLIDNRKRIKTLNKVASEANRSIKIMMDLPGRKNRILSKNTMWVAPGDRHSMEWSNTQNKQLSSDIQLLFPMPFDEIDPSTIIYFGDGDFSAHYVSSIQKQTIVVEFDNCGEVAFGRGVTFYQKKSKKMESAITERDKQFLRAHSSLEFDFIALSFVNSGKDVIELRNYLNRITDKLPKLIAKIETEQALYNLKEIILVSDGVMIARGDLALNIPFERLPFIQRQIISMANSLKKPVIVATQMLESISTKQIPHRSEITDIATAVYQGASALMLSGETRSGKEPVNAVKIMDKVIRQAEIDRRNEID